MTTTAPTSTGTVATSGSTTYISSTASGLDTNSLVNAAVAQKTARADTLDADVTANQTKIAAYQKLQGLLTALSSSLTPLKSTAFSTLGSTNAFDEKQAFLTASDGSDPTATVAVSTDTGAVATAYDLSVTQLAKAMKVAATAQDSATPLGLAGAFSLGTGLDSAQITVTSDMTLNDLATAISNASGQTGVSATVLKVGTGSYQLVLAAASANQPINAASVSGDDVLSSIGLTNSSGAFATVLQRAQPAIATVDGVQVTSDSNQMTDVIPGVSLSLLQTTAPGASVTVDIEPNYSDLKSAVTSFVTAYNALQTYITSQEAVSGDGTVSSDAVLFADSTLRSAETAIAGLASKISTASGSDVNDLSDIGLTFNGDNTLTLSDEDKLDNALLSDLPAFQSFFETSMTSSDAGLKVLNNTSTLSSSFNLQITTAADGSLTGATVNGQGGLFTVSGNRIVGATGSIYAGLSFAYVGAASTTSTMSVTINQGFADLMTNIANGYGDANTGMIKSQIDGLNSTDADMTTQSTQIRDDAETYRTSLINKYATMETKVSAAKLLQQQIQAILNGNSNNDN